MIYIDKDVYVDDRKTSVVYNNIWTGGLRRRRRRRRPCYCSCGRYVEYVI